LGGSISAIAAVDERPEHAGLWRRVDPTDPFDLEIEDPAQPVSHPSGHGR
jgi:hypothetical protein